MTRLSGAVAAVALLACGGGEAVSTPAPKPAVAVAEAPTRPDVAGVWRATLASPGGELPFGLEIDSDLSAVAINGDERVKFSSAAWRGAELVLRIAVYDSEIRATVDESRDRLTGTWTKTTPKGPSTMKFAATRGELPRFDAAIPEPGHAVPESVDGVWSIVFAEDDGSTFVGQGEFAANSWTILTDTGDYRYLAGRYESGTLELSCFDGGHAFLFRAAVDTGGKLRGDFWSRGQYHATWVGTRMKDGEAGPLADPYAVVSAKDKKFSFSFPNLDGKVVSDTDFKGKALLVDIFGTWCPNCNDYAPVLQRWHERYRDRGLQVVGLAFEMTGDVKRDNAFVKTFATKYGITFPLLLAGTSDKKDAAALLPSLNKIASYPTTVLVNRAGQVQKIHSGFAGPATGRHHEELVKSLESEIESLLD